jgi:oxygen-independent coproporphyrinogen-3 oxidase
LQGNGIAQYEISNFARLGSESRHNLKYWTRQPYLGFGVDAHSMLASSEPEFNAVRFATSDVLEKYVAGGPLQKTTVPLSAALEENFFLGLRLNRGVDLQNIATNFGQPAVAAWLPVIAGLVTDGLLLRDHDCIRLTSRGRLLSNEVFQAFLLDQDVPIPS